MDHSFVADKRRLTVVLDCSSVGLEGTGNLSDMSRRLTVKVTWHRGLIYLLELLRSPLTFQHFNPPHECCHLCFGYNGVFNRMYATPWCGSWVCVWWLTVEPFPLHDFFCHFFKEFSCSIICHPHEVTVTHGFKKDLRTVIDTLIDYLTETPLFYGMVGTLS